MATCPRCLGALTAHHRCPRGLGRRITEMLATVGIGALVGAIFCFAIEDRPAGALVLATAVLGGVLAAGVRKAIH